MQVLPISASPSPNFLVSVHRSTPGSLSAAGFLLVVAAVASAYAGEGAVDIAAVAFGLFGVTAFVAGRCAADFMMERFYEGEACYVVPLL